MGLTFSREKNGLKFNRQPSKKVIFFYGEQSKMHMKINRQKVSRYLKSHYLS